VAGRGGAQRSETHPHRAEAHLGQRERVLEALEHADDAVVELGIGTKLFVLKVRVDVPEEELHDVLEILPGRLGEELGRHAAIVPGRRGESLVGGEEERAGLGAAAAAALGSSARAVHTYERSSKKSHRWRMLAAMYCLSVTARGSLRPPPPAPDPKTEDRRVDDLRTDDGRPDDAVDDRRSADDRPAPPPPSDMREEDTDSRAAACCCLPSKDMRVFGPPRLLRPADMRVFAPEPDNGPPKVVRRSARARSAMVYAGVLSC